MALGVLTSATGGKMAAVVSLAAMLAACSSLPSAGPTSHALMSQASAVVTGKDIGSRKNVPFVLVDINEVSLDILAKYGIRRAAGSFTNRQPAADLRIGVGDSIRVSVFESGSGGLFTPATGSLSQGNFVELPVQEVDRTGTIKVPYLGNVNVSGRRPSEIEAEIEAALRDRAIEPQVIVTIASRGSARYTVVGEVNGPGVFNLTQGGERVLDAIGAAGGTKYAENDTLVTLQSGAGRETTVRLSAIIAAPSNNIYLQPGDTLALSRDQRVFTVFGAAGLSGQIPFSEDSMSLADGLAKAGGLLDGAADAKSVVVYRILPRQALEALNADLGGFEPGTQNIPTVLRLDLSKGGGFFIAGATALEPNDIIYISNASLYDLTKVTAIVRDIAGTVVSVDSAVQAVTN